MNLNTYDSNLQVATSSEGEVVQLQGERFAWGKNRRKGVRLVRLYRKSGFENYAERAQMCATQLQFYVMETGEKQLMGANFCHLRLCPMCTARRARRAAYKLTKVMRMVEADHPGTMFLFLTLTIKNVSGDQLGDAIGQLTKAWYRLMDNRQIERSVNGWFRTVETTRNRKTKKYHPHIHAILAVSPEYFSRKSGLYITHDEWVERWQKALRVDYKPTVRIQTTKAKGEYTAELAAAVEAGKYAVKDSDYIDDDLPDEEAAQVVKDYTNALHRRRLTAFGGWMKEAAKALNAENLDDGDLIHAEEETIRADIADFIETYNWHFGMGDYVLTSRQVNPLKLRRKD